MELDIQKLLDHMITCQASDLHLSAEQPPIMRIKGRLKRLSKYPKLESDVLDKAIIKLLNGIQNERLYTNKEVDFSTEIKGKARFRGHVFVELKSLSAVFRMIPNNPGSMEELGVPMVLREIALKPRGLVLVTGPTGSGKTTTLASIIAYMNRARNSHIVTIEDPIEYVFESKNCLVRQREIGQHAITFPKALRASLRQDPDIIMVGEMRDATSMETVMEAAETGHLVFSTLHTNNAPDSILRILSSFPSEQSKQISTQLAAVLIAIMSQQLLPHKSVENRQVLATELMITTPAISNLIREGQVHMIRNSIETGHKHGMHTMDQNLKILLDKGEISTQTALQSCLDPKNFRNLVGIDGMDQGGRFHGVTLENSPNVNYGVSTPSKPARVDGKTPPQFNPPVRTKVRGGDYDF
ncbi:MAG: type IV pilus twitching motility protein PilT [Vulcanimicrobiota bacterium]